jgi:hypothetical protein
MDQIQLKLSYEWQPVFLREKVEYLFPVPITPSMRINYRPPAVFKWDIFTTTPGDKKLVYIGDAQELCPKRLYGYLNPGPTQKTNQKINAEFREYLKEKLSIGLYICKINEISFGEATPARVSLDDKYIRLMIVNAMIYNHKQKGFTVNEL